ncbi:MAG: sodium/solute symporter [Planctomycetes bacterium]|nr:sodium/solute symporter [Planctomycetota bacterium]
MSLGPLDLACLLAFFAVVVGVSLIKSRRRKDSAGYFLAGRGLTWPLIGLSIVAANISTEQLVGMAGQGAGTVGLAVSAWQLTGAIGIVVIAFTLLPRFLRAGIYTMPEFLEYRYNPAARAIMATYTTIIYVAVNMAAVLYAGGLTLNKLFGVELTTAIWLIGAVAAVYTTWGGLLACAWADLFQGAALLIGGLLTMALGFHAVGGVQDFFAHNADRLHVFLPAQHPDLPWTGVLAGMWIPIVYYCGLNQFIVQRTLAARSLAHGQLGITFAAALWLLIPFAIVIPGIIARQLYGDQLATADEAYPTLFRNLIPPGLRGFMFAAIAGAVVSTLASLLNSAATIFTMDLFHRHWAPQASQKTLVWMGRSLTLVFVIVGCMIAPALDNPRFGGVFNFIQQFQGYIWTGTVAAFLYGFGVPRAPAAAGVAALLAGPAIYGLMQWRLPQVHFLLQVAMTLVLLIVLMTVITLARPLREPRVIPTNTEMDLRSSPAARLAGVLVIAAVIAFFIVFR